MNRTFVYLCLFNRESDCHYRVNTRLRWDPCWPRVSEFPHIHYQFWRFDRKWRTDDWMTECQRDRMTEWLKDWRTEWLKDWRAEGLEDWRTEWLIDWMTEGLNVRGTERLKDWRTGGRTENDTIVLHHHQLSHRSNHWERECIETNWLVNFSL